MNKKEILNCLKKFSFCNDIECSKCICNKTSKYYNRLEDVYTGCCQHFLYIAKQCIKENNFKNLCSFLKEECDGRFPKDTDQIDEKWFIPFFKNNSLELE